MAFDFDPRALPEWLRLPALPPAPSLPALPWLTSLPWFRRDENVQPTPGERPTLGQRIGATIGQRMARMYAPPAASAPSAAPTAAGHQGSEAAAEPQKIIDHRGIVLNDPIGGLAHLQIGRAYTMQGETAKAKAAYQDFLRLWKDPTPTSPS
jgi:hypothetical protein